VLVRAQWLDPADTEVNIAWARETFESLRPHLSERRYTNFLSADDAGSVRQAFGENHERLVTVKRRYDPDNLFHLNHNLDPVG
jgi:FAD/FMN-containing dehydrogenase